MFLKKLKYIFVIIILYQTPLSSKSTTFDNFYSKNLSNYFSGIVAFENKNNPKALNFFNSSKILINKHDPYLKRYVYSLVLENKISQAINIIKQNKNNNNSVFFESYILLIIDSLKKNDLVQASNYLLLANKIAKEDQFNLAIIETLKQYLHVFKEKKILDKKKNLGNLSIISETFQRCYLEDPKTETYFSQMINNNEGDFSRYIFFYLSHLIEKKRFSDAEKISHKIKLINSNLLLSQAKDWIERNKAARLSEVFSCQNHNDILSEFLFIISNLYSSQDNFIKSNFYLNISYFLNPKFIFNLSLVVENQYLNKEYNKAKDTLKNFKKNDEFYYWYRLKKEAQIISKQRNEKESLNYITSNYNKIENPNIKILFDIANFHKNAKEYDEAIKYYTRIINQVEDDLETKSDLLYRRGGSYERIGNYELADKDLLYSLEINPNDAYVLNYLAYSWLERNYKINTAIEMLEKAYSYKSNDPYIIDSIGWAYYLIDDYEKAEKYLRRAVQLMPNDTIVNDHYGDILWKLGRQIQARYFWGSALKMKNINDKLSDEINSKIIKGL
ncbi:tetratricopeptide repeat protein [Pelagibacterales bacterium SAG-MED13]|nr:tetratricopeptide repeat protein [Pelagibacterales bacterium SAG-MED13]